MDLFVYKMANVELKTLTADNKPTCQAITKSGTQCSRAAEAGSNYCWQHQDYIALETKDEKVLEATAPELKLMNSTKFTQEDNKKLIALVQSQVHPTMRLSEEALDLINNLTYPLYLFFEEANGSSSPESKENLTNLVKATYPGFLAQHAIKEINRNQGLIKNNINTIPVEYIIAELTETAGNSLNLSRTDNKSTVTYYHVNFAIHNDTELSQLFKNNKASSDLFFGYKLKINDYLGKGDAISKIYTKAIKPNGVTFTATQYRVKTALVNYLINTCLNYSEDQLSSIGYNTPMTYFINYVRTYKTELEQAKTWKSMTDFLIAHDLIQFRLNQYCSNVTGIMQQDIAKSVCENIVTQYL